MDVTPGWYPDPEDPTNLRWWDGSVWTDHRQPIGSTAEPPDTSDADATVDLGAGSAAEEAADPEADADRGDEAATDAGAGQDDAGEGEPDEDQADGDTPDEPDFDPEKTIPRASLVFPSSDEPVTAEPTAEQPATDERAAEEPAADEVTDAPPADVGEQTIVGGSAPPWPTAPAAAGAGAGDIPPPPPPPGAGGDVPPPPPAAGVGAPPVPPPEPAKSKKGPVLIGLGIVVVIALIAGAAFVLLGGDEGADYTWDGEAIAEPQATIDDADEIFLAGVEERNGAVDDDSRCYFVQPAAEDAENPSDVFDYLRCGPVLFVDDDPGDGAWITYALGVDENEEGDIELSAADQPQSGQPSTYDDDEELLSRPDGEEAPSGHGGLEPPDPPPAEPGTFLNDDPVLEDMELDSAFATATGQTKTMTLDAFAEVDRYGSDDDARSAPDGERFLVFEVSPSAGDELFYANRDARDEALRNSEATISLDVDGETTELFGTDDDPFIFSRRFLASAPESAEMVDLVLDDVDREQRISLLTQEPAPDNIDVLTRFERTADLDAQKAFPATVTLADGTVINDTFTATIQNAALQYYVRQAPDRVPSSPDNAFLVINQFFTSVETEITEEDAIALEPGHLRLRIGDETIQAVNLAPDDGDILVAFEVPGTFESGTLVVRGNARSGDIMIDLGNPDFRVPIEIENF